MILGSSRGKIMEEKMKDRENILVGTQFLKKHLLGTIYSTICTHSSMIIISGI